MDSSLKTLALYTYINAGFRNPYFWQIHNGKFQFPFLIFVLPVYISSFLNAKNVWAGSLILEVESLCANFDRYPARTEKDNSI